MSSFELVNHQIRHLFGGIEAEKNSSLEYLESCQRKIVKAMERAEENHRKIYEAVQVIKRSIADLNDNYLQLSKENKHSGGLISEITSQLNHFLQDLGEDCLACAKKMERKVENYVPNMRAFKEKYTEKAENLEHYKTKVGLLRKGVQKQSKANVKQDEHERFQRNKFKLSIAEKQHDEALIRTTKRFIEFNNEGMKDVYNDYLQLLASVSSNAMAMSHGVGSYLRDGMGNRELVIAKHHLGKAGVAVANQPFDSKNFLEHLVGERQIRDYIQNFIDQELLKMDQRQRVSDYFKDRPRPQSMSFSYFDSFDNLYGDHYFAERESKDTAMSEIKEEEPVEDLLEMQTETQINSARRKEEDTQILEEEIVMTPTVSKDKDQQLTETEQEERERQEKQEKAQRFRDNLAKFNKLCRESQQVKTVNLSPTPNRNTAAVVDKKQYQTINRPLVDNLTLLNSDQFFDITRADSSINGPPSRPLSTIVPQTAFAKTVGSSQFDFFDQKNVRQASNFPTFSKQQDFVQNDQPPNSFEAFDVLVGQKVERNFKKASVDSDLI